VENNELTVTGRRSMPAVEGTLLHRESRPENFRRTFELDPSIDAEKISAKIEHGVVSLTLPKAEQVSTFHCVTGWTVKNVHWGGVRFQQLFDLVQPLPSATAVRFVSLEQPYEDSLTLDQLRLPDAMLALELGGQPLSRPHGSPARVILPEMYGYKGVKWLTKMEFVAKQPRGYWEQHGYDQNAWVGRSNGYGT